MEEQEVRAVEGRQQADKKRNVIVELWGKLWFRIVAITLAAIIAVFVILGITVACVWSDEIATLGSFKKLRDRYDDNKEGSVYFMDVKGGYYFDDFLKKGGASTDSELLAFITGNITRGLVDVKIGETNIGCSSFTAKTPSGDILFARNYDFAKTNVSITLANPGGDRHKSFSSVDLNYIGLKPDKDVSGFMNNVKCLAAPYVPLDGINDAGVSCGIYMSYQGDKPDPKDSSKRLSVATNQKDENKKNITSTTMLRMVLDYADDVDEAVELIRKYNLHDSANTSFHYMVADATGKSAILEWIPENGTDLTDNDGSARKLNVIYNTDAMYDDVVRNKFEFQWVTNFIVKDQDTYYENNDAKKGFGRYDLIREHLASTGGQIDDEKAAMKILKEVGQRTFGGGGGCTVHSAVYNLTKKTVLWVSNENYDKKGAAFEFDFKTWKLSSVELSL